MESIRNRSDLVFLVAGDTNQYLLLCRFSAVRHTVGWLWPRVLWNCEKNAACLARVPIIWHINGVDVGQRCARVPVQLWGSVRLIVDSLVVLALLKGSACYNMPYL